MKKRMLAAMAVAMMVILAGIARSEGAQSKLTLMIYMCGSNLESRYGSASADIDEMTFSGVNSRQANVLVMTGGSRVWSNGQNAGSIQIRRLKGGQMISAWEQDAMDMGDAATLTALLDWGVENYPAERYALILWDHGAGPLEGVCYDELYAPDCLSLDEVAQALEASSLPGRLTWIGFDACLMGSLEVASKVAPYADYMIASQEREPASGWDYGFLRGIEEDADGAATGRRIVDAYMDYPRSTPADLTLTCVDLSALRPVETCLDDMYGKLAVGLTAERFSKLSQLRFSARGFGKAVETNEVSSGYDLVDIVSLSECLIGEDEQKMRDLRRAVESAVVYHRENLDDCCGLSIYHPFRNQKSFLARWNDAYSALDFCAGYSTYIGSYGKIMSGRQLVLWNDLKNIRVSGSEASDDASVITLKLSEAQLENLGSARLVVLARNIFDEADEAYFRVYTTADVSREGDILSAIYDGKSMQILNESGTDTLTGAVSYRVTEDGLYLLPLYPVEEDGTRWTTPIIAEYEQDDGGWLAFRGYSVFDELTGAYTSRVDVDLSRFAGITFINDYRLPVRNSADEILDFERWREDEHREAQLKSRYHIRRTSFMPSFAQDPSRSEDLYAGYEITDTQGNTYMSEIVPLSGRSSVQHYVSDINLGDDVPDLWATLFTFWEERCIEFILNVENLSDVPQTYAVMELKINDIATNEAMNALYNLDMERVDALNPGEHGWVVVDIDAGALDGLQIGDTLDRLSGTLGILSGKSEGKANFIQFSAEPGITLNAIFHDGAETAGEDESIEDLPLSTVVDADNDTTVVNRVILQPAKYAESARIIVNAVLSNRGARDVFFRVRDVRLNGVPIDDVTVVDQNRGRRTDDSIGIGPGEQSAVNIVLDYDDIARIQPAVSLDRISYRLTLAEMVDGETESLNILPFDINLSVPLDSFYDGATTLPPQNLVELGNAMESLNEQNAMALFQDAPCNVLLQGLYAMDRSFVMLLRFENDGDVTRRVDLGFAELDGKATTIGTQMNVLAEMRNNRVRTYFLDKPQWFPERGVSLILRPGETAYRYVTVALQDDNQVQVQSIRFKAYMRESGNALNYTCFDDCEIDTGEPVPLSDGVLMTAPASDITVTPGREMTRPVESPLFRNEIQMPEGDPGRWAIRLDFEPDADEVVEAGYYVLFREVKSDAELAALNIGNDISTDDKTSEVSFSDGRQWLIFEACGRLEVAEGGCVATAIYPGLRPVVRVGSESFPLTVTLNGKGEGDLLTFDEILNAVIYCSTGFPSVFSPIAVGNIKIVVDTASRTATLDSYNASGKDMNNLLRGLIGQDVFMTPADADTDVLTELIEGEGTTKQQQVQLLDDPQLQLAIEPVEDIENYLVAFYYKNSDGIVKCTVPKPLTDEAHG